MWLLRLKIKTKQNQQFIIKEDYFLEVLKEFISQFLQLNFQISYTRTHKK